MSTSPIRAAHCCALVEMVSCDRCSETAAPKCLMEPKLCGKCCRPRCGEGIHNVRHSGRGKKGRISKEERWNKVWREAHKKTVHIWKNAPLRRHMLESGDTFGSIRYHLMHDLHQRLRSGPGEGRRTTIEVAVAMPPREQEELVESMMEDFGEDDVPLLPVDTAMTLDEDADPEDLEASWTRASEPAPSSSAAASSGRPHREERPPARGALAEPTESSSSAGPSANDPLLPPPWSPQGKPVLDEANRECSHYRRRVPALNAVAWSTSMSAEINDNAASYSSAERVLRYWMNLRPGLTDSFQSLEARPYPWRAGPGDSEEQMSKTHSWGVYFYCKLKEWWPKPRADIDVVTGRSSRYHDALENLIHASSMYSVHRTTLRGLEPGPLRGKGGMLGVYTFRPCGLSAAISSSGYAVYSWIGGSFLASPRYDIAAETYRAGEPDIGKIAAGEGQLCLKPGMYYVRGVWFHLLTRRDVARGPPTWCNWDDWFPEHELPLEASSAM